MASGKYDSEDQLLLDAFHSLDAEDEDLRVMQEGIDSIDRDEAGVSVEEAFRQLRANHQIRESA